MAETKSLAASVRSGVGKGAARSVRREGRIPAVVYGGGEPPQPISLSWHEVNKLIYAGGFMTTAFELDIDGAKERVIPRDYQLDRVKDRPLHVDFLRVKKGQKVQVDVPVHVTGQEVAPGVKQGGVLNIVLHAVSLTVSADAIPEAIAVDASKLDMNEAIHGSDLKLPSGARLSNPGDAELAVVMVTPPDVVEEEEEEAPAAEDASEEAPEKD